MPDDVEEDGAETVTIQERPYFEVLVETTYFWGKQCVGYYEGAVSWLTLRYKCTGTFQGKATRW
jgi:hypothetical protein